MKVTYLAHIRFPSERAHGAQVAHMCNAFAQNDCEVTLVATKRPNVLTEDAFTYYNIPESFNVVKLFSSPFNIASTFGYFLSMWIFAFRAALYARKDKSDMVYSRDELVLWVASFFVSTKKLVWESHEAKYNFTANNLLRRGVKCVAISEGIRDFYLSMGVKNEQILVAHDGIDESFFGELESKEVARTRLGIQSEIPVVMYIGGLDSWKGVETFFEASKSFRDVSFVVIGGTDEAIEKYKEIYPNVSFLGRRPYRELKDNQQAADVLVCTNSTVSVLSEKFTSPLKLFSYMTAKVPLLAADVESITSVVSENEVFLYNPERSESVIEKIQEILTNKEEAEKRAMSAYELSKKFVWTARARDIVEFVKP